MTLINDFFFFFPISTKITAWKQCKSPKELFFPLSTCLLNILSFPITEYTFVYIVILFYFILLPTIDNIQSSVTDKPVHSWLIKARNGIYFFQIKNRYDS